MDTMANYKSNHICAPDDGLAIMAQIAIKYGLLQNVRELNGPTGERLRPYQPVDEEAH